MKKRQKHKIEKRFRDDIHHVLDLVLDINGISERKRAITGNMPTAFFDFSGHTATIYIRIHENGWVPNADPDYKLDVYIDQKHLSQAIKDLEVIKHVLQM